MILKNQSKKSLINFIIVSVILVSANKAIAQQEMPDNIKTQVLAGITALDSAKVPKDLENAFNLI